MKNRPNYEMLRVIFIIYFLFGNTTFPSFSFSLSFFFIFSSLLLSFNFLFVLDCFSRNVFFILMSFHCFFFLCKYILQNKLIKSTWKLTPTCKKKKKKKKKKVNKNKIKINMSMLMFKIKIS